MTSLESRIRGAVLGALRRLKRWPGLRLAEAVGTSEAMISHYETGSKELSAERFQEIGQAMGYSRRRLEAARFGLGVSLRELAEDLDDGAGEPVNGVREAEIRSESEALSRRLAAEMAGLTASRTIDRALQSAHLRRRVKRERAQAAELCRRLLKLPVVQQGIWIAEDPVFQGWAVIERLGEMSETVASSSPIRARQLALWAEQLAESGPPSLDRPRKIAYARFFLANALRVGGRLKEAQAIFIEAWSNWRIGEVPGAPPFARWRPFDLEASLRRDQELWGLAADLCDKALVLAPPTSVARILLKKANCLQVAGASAAALPVLAKAASLIDADNSPYLAQIAHFTFALCLFDLQRLTEAASHLARARALSGARESPLDIARCEWLGGRLGAVQGNRDAALAAFARARAIFACHGVAHDCAAVALHESLVLLEAGELQRAKHIAAAVAWTFASEGIAYKGRKALEVYCQAAQREEASLELAQWALSEIRPSLPQEKYSPKEDLAPH